MAFSVSVFKDLNLVVTIYSGFVDSAQLKSAQLATVDDVNYRPGMVELTSLCDVRATDLDFSLVFNHRKRMEGYYGSHAGKTLHHMIASTDLAFGMARMYLTLVEESIPNLDLRLYRCEREALQAVGRSETSISQLVE